MFKHNGRDGHLNRSSDNPLPGDGESGSPDKDRGEDSQRDGPRLAAYGKKHPPYLCPYASAKIAKLKEGK